MSLALRQRRLYGRLRRNNAGKESDPETGLYYFGARYLDPKTSRWISGDPAVGEYIPVAPINEEARKRNGSLPGMGGVFNYVNLHVYHYAGNNPVKYVDPDGRDSFGWEILMHYLFGCGEELIINNEKWGDYMRGNELLRTQIRNELYEYAMQYNDDESFFFTGDFSIQFHAEIENGEDINGYHYLHGSNRNVGDFQLTGVMVLKEDNVIKFLYIAQWNDIINPNYTYDTDRWKSRIAKIISFGLATDYIIRIRWLDTMTFIFDSSDATSLEQ